MEIKDMKSEFVKNELTSLLRKADKTIQYADYSKDENGEEYVLIKFSDGRQRVCVTCDSILAIAKDVIDAINY